MDLLFFQEDLISLSTSSLYDDLANLCLYDYKPMRVIQISVQPHQHKNQCVSDFLALWFAGASDGDNPIARGIKYGIQPKIKVTKEDLANLVRKGFIYYNQKKVPHLPFMAQGKCKIMVALPDEFFPLSESKNQLSINEKNIVFEDEDMVIINKPSGLPSQSTLNIFEDHALSSLMSFYIKKNKGVKAPYLNLMHRLDKDTSGLLIFSKKLAANKNLTALFESRKITKSYLAVTSSRFVTGSNHDVSTKTKDNTGLTTNSNTDTEGLNEGQTFKITGLIKKTPQPGMSFYFTLDPHEGQASETDFKVIKKTDKKLLIECFPKTGRSHQIRVHLKSYGLPILGDTFYNPESKANRLMLHAWKLEFKHPVNGKQISVAAPIPSEFQL
jgi:23S rRNA pseudouridine1911/1915/1917 synthase